MLRNDKIICHLLLINTSWMKLEYIIPTGYLCLKNFFLLPIYHPSGTQKYPVGIIYRRPSRGRKIVVSLTKFRRGDILEAFRSISSNELNKWYSYIMNNRLSITYLILMSVPLFFGCGGSAKEGNKNNASASTTSSGQKYTIDTNESVVTWEGFMVFSFEKEHIGYVHLSKGELMIEKDKLVGGIFEIDMNTIEYADKEDKNTPIKHLKSADYFDVEKFPTSTFIITRVDSVIRENIKVTGDLTIKGVTNEVTFPARMEIKDGIVKANGKLTFDRTEWGIRYRSGKFYDNLADQAVSDDVELEMKIVARK